MNTEGQARIYKAAQEHGQEVRPCYRAMEEEEDQGGSTACHKSPNTVHTMNKSFYGNQIGGPKPNTHDCKSSRRL